jgi:hypothetical protein
MLVSFESASEPVSGKLAIFPERSTPRGEPSLKPALAVFCVYVAYAIIMFPNDYRALLFGSVFQLTGFSFALVAVLVYFDAWRRMPAAPSVAFLTTLKDRGPVLAAGVLAFVFGLTAFTAYKVNIPNLVPFYADPLLARIDREIHGINPWDVVSAIPERYASVIDLFYGKIWPAALIVTYLGAFSLMNGRALCRYLWTVMFVYIGLGGVVATFASSVGPIFYTDFYAPAYDFAAQRQAILTNPYLADMQFYTDYLLSNFKSGGPAFGTGISAFPSVHVAVATLTAWVLTSHGRAGAVFGWVFYAIIEFGSVYTGWHYAIGGYFSTIAVCIFWIGMSRYYGLPLMGRGGRRRTSQLAL